MCEGWRVCVRGLEGVCERGGGVCVKEVEHR